MTNIQFISNSLSKKHSNGMYHPESPQRIEVVEKWISDKVNNEITFQLYDQLATEEEITSVHSTYHYKLVKKTQEYKSQFYFDADTGANEYTFNAARQAVAVGNKAIFESDRNNSIFALVRPPGHHATRNSPMGFCIFNNIAIATTLAQQKKKFKRIAIIDFDHHFGNGTAYIHEKNPNILYISTHASPTIAYPQSGFVDEIGKEEGVGYTICIPLTYKASEIDIKLAFDHLILPIIFQFRPEFLAISAGFDAYERDPIGVLGISSEGFSLIGALMQKISSDLKIPIANYLEGGYNIKMLPTLISAYVSPIQKENHEEIIKEYELKTKDSLKPKNETYITLEKAKNLLGDFWQL